MPISTDYQSSLKIKAEKAINKKAVLGADIDISRYEEHIERGRIESLEGLSHLEFCLFPFVPLFYGPQVSDNPRVNFGLFFATRTRLLFASQVSMNWAHAECRGEREIGESESGYDFLDKTFYGIHVFDLFA